MNLCCRLAEDPHPCVGVRRCRRVSVWCHHRRSSSPSVCWPQRCRRDYNDSAIRFNVCLCVYLSLFIFIWVIVLCVVVIVMSVICDCSEAIHRASICPLFAALSFPPPVPESYFPRFAQVKYEITFTGTCNTLLVSCEYRPKAGFMSTSSV
jgi:hypothetical protein